MEHSKIIDNLGGTTAVAELCDVRPPSVSEWRRRGIPKARLMYLQAIRPEAFVEGESLQQDLAHTAAPAMPAQQRAA